MTLTAKTPHRSYRWLKLVALLVVPLILAIAIAKRASWRPRILQYADPVMAVAYSPDGRWLACASQSKLELRDAHTEQVVWSEALGDDTSKAVAFSPDSKIIAVGRDTSLQLWNVPEHRLQHDLLAHYPYWYDARVLLFTPDSAHLITGGDASQVLLWDARTGKLSRILADQKISTPLALDAKHQVLALLARDSNTSYVSLQNLVTGQQQQTLCSSPGDPSNCAAFAPDHKTIATGTDKGAILLWSVITGHETRQLDTRAAVTRLAFSADGQLLASGELDNSVQLWDTRRWRCLRTLTIRGRAFYDLAFAPDSATLAVACGQTVQLWRIK